VDIHSGEFRKCTESHSVLLVKPSWRTAAIGSKCWVERFCLSSFVSLPRKSALPLLSLICVRKEKRRLCLPSTCSYHVTSSENCYQKSVQICTAYAFILFVYISGTEVSNCLLMYFAILKLFSFSTRYHEIKLRSWYCRLSICLP
jgi:hypothetical protein